MILFFCLVLIGCVLEIKTSSDNPLPVEQILSGIVDALEVNVIPLLDNIEDEQVQIVQQRHEQVQGFADEVTNSYNQLRNSERFTIEDLLITNQISNDITSLNADYQDQLQNGPVAFETSIEYYNRFEQFYQNLNTYVVHMLNQYAEEELSENITSIQSMENGISQDMSFRTDSDIIARRRLELEELVLEIREINEELKKIEERDVHDVQRTRELRNDVHVILDDARIQIQTRRLTIPERLEIISMIVSRYRALHSHIKNMNMMYQQRIIDRRLELSEFMERVQKLLHQLNLMRGRNESEIEKTDQLIDEINAILPLLVNRAENIELTYEVRLENIRLIKDYFQRLDDHLQDSLNSYKQSTQQNDSKGQSSQQVCPSNQHGISDRKRMGSSSDNECKKIKIE